MDRSSNNTPGALNEVCQRCGQPFHCGVDDPAGCACCDLTLTPELTARLRQTYQRCLCLVCLKALQQGADFTLAPISAARRP